MRQVLWDISLTIKMASSPLVWRTNIWSSDRYLAPEAERTCFSSITLPLLALISAASSVKLAANCWPSSHWYWNSGEDDEQPANTNKTLKSRAALLGFKITLREPIREYRHPNQLERKPRLVACCCNGTNRESAFARTFLPSPSLQDKPLALK